MLCRKLVQIILLRSRDVMSEVGTNNITKKKRCYVGKVG